jgi:hypothetical protein
MNLLKPLFFIALTIALQSSCVHNYEPMISSIQAEPNPAPLNSIVSLTCKASDDDESSMMKKESLEYEWSCAFGEVLSVDQDHTATWIAPDQPGEYSISCTVTDRFNGADILTIDVTVQ